MGMVLSDQEYVGEYIGPSYSIWKWLASKLKGILGLLFTLSPILWIVFFLMLTLLTNFLSGLLYH